MARRALARALSGAALGASNAVGDLLRLGMQQQQQHAMTQRQTAQNLLDQIFKIDDALTTKVQTGEITPEMASQQATAARARYGIRNPSPTFEAFAPSEETRMAPILKGILDARERDDPSLTDEGILAQAKVRRLPTVSGQLESGPATPKAEAAPGDVLPMLTRNYAQAEPSDALAMLTKTAGGVRRRMSDVAAAKANEAVDLAGRTSEAQGLGTERAAAASAPAVLGRQVVEQNTMGPLRTREAANTAGAQEEARLRVQFSPTFYNARLQEARDKAVISLDEFKARLPLQQANELQTARLKEHQAQVAEGLRAVAQLRPSLEKIADLTSRINTREGTMARAQGLILQGKASMGGAADVTELKNELGKITRSLAVAFGIREANVSERETTQIQEAIGISVYNTREERWRALRNLRDLDLAPIVAARLGPDATLDQKLDAWRNLQIDRARVEMNAMKAYDKEVGEGRMRSDTPQFFLDPVTGAMTPILRK